MKMVQSGLAVIYRVVNWILQLPRLTRIVLAGVFALALTLVITPLVDEFYIANFYDVETREAPALFSTALGVVFYIVGWRLIIGFAGEAPAASRSVAWYLGIGAVACALVVVLVVFGAISGTIT